MNLALSFARLGHRAGILDTDIFGPSIPTLLNLAGEQPRLSEKKQLLPLSNYGVKSMSMGYLVGEEAPVVWRGLMVMKALQQLLWEVEWGGLDVLVMDLPPGTGDTQLTITQQVVLDGASCLSSGEMWGEKMLMSIRIGAIVVSTPQDVALKDAVRGVEMMRKVEVPVCPTLSSSNAHDTDWLDLNQLLGMIQNMSVFNCPNCNHSTHIFGSEGVRKACEKHDVPFLGDLPLHASICDDADRGKPTVVAEPESPRAKAFTAIAELIAKTTGL